MDDDFADQEALPRVGRVVLAGALLQLALAACATAGTRCEHSVSECIGRCQATMPDRKPALANPDYVSLSECESLCECRPATTASSKTGSRPTPTGVAQ